MSKLLVIDLDRCWGCRACEVACKQEHDLGLGFGPLQVMKEGPRQLSGQLRVAHVPALCQHCRQPACLPACPGGALEKLPDGRVLLDDRHCSACGACADACPYGAVGFNQGSGRMAKCDLCREREGLGLPPACLQHCLGRAMAWLEADQLEFVARGRYHWSVGRVVYLASTRPALGQALGK